jgi:hypothetical protein
VEGSCGHGNEHSGFIKCGEILEQLSYWRLAKKDSAPWSYFRAMDFSKIFSTESISYKL